MKTVLITGGTRGIGKATAHVFAFHHYNLVLTYQKDKKSAEQTKEEIEKKYPVRVCLIEGNMAREEDIEMIVNESYQQFGTIDCLVNNAAIALDTTFDDKNKTNF